MTALAAPQVLHQALWLDFDTTQAACSGHTQLQLLCPGAARCIGLNSFNLDITGVKVDGIDADFEQRAYSQPLADQDAGLTSNAPQLAEQTFFEYQRLVQKEAEPELVIQLPDRIVGDIGTNAEQPMESEDAKEQAPAEVAVTVAFALQQPECGVHFHGQYAYTNAQVRRSRAWFPCVDVPLAACPFDLHFTVAANQTAVSSGQLIKQTWVNRGKRRCFHYKLSIPTPPQDIALAIGPFAAWQAGIPLKPIQAKVGDAATAAAQPAGNGTGSSGSQFPPSTPLQTPPYSALRTPKTPRTPALGDAGSRADVSTLTNFAPPELRGAADHTLKTLGLAFNMFETYLGCKFPYKALQTVVMPEGMTQNRTQHAAGLQIFSGELMVTERIVEQAMEVRVAVAHAVAHQWFGALMRARTPADAWLVEGLAGYLSDLFLRRFLGKNELRFRRYKEAEAIYLADDGQAPPLYCKAPLALQWGSLYGTEHLDPSGLRKWKATAVIWMLSGKVSEDIFRQQLERLVGAAVHHLQQGGPHVVDPAQNPMLLSSREFMRELGKGAGARKELSAMSLRWINLRGVPRITAAFTYHKKKNALELAVRQQGSQAARASTEQAAQQAAKEGSAVGLLKVVLKEHDHDNVLMLQLAAKPLMLQELKVDTKPGTKRGKKVGGRKKKDDMELDDLDDEDRPQQEQEADDAAAADRPPVQWLEIDPERESLTQVKLLQPDWMWAAQLEHSKDTAMQSAAVAGLAALRPTTYTVVSALDHCLQDDQVYPRVRQEAAMALASTASAETEYAGLQILLKLVTARCITTSSSLGSLLLADQTAAAQAGIAASWGSDVGEYLVNEALPLALASVRDEKGQSPSEAADSLIEVLKHTDNRGHFYDNSSMLAALLQAVGGLRMPDSKSLKQAVHQLDRFLARERVLPTYHNTVAQAALRAFTELALAMKGNTPFHARVTALCRQHLQASCHPELRRTAYACLLSLTAALSGLNAALRLGLDAVQQETPLVRLGVMEDMQPIILQHAPQSVPPAAQVLPASGSSEATAVEVGQVSQETMLRFQSLFRQHACVRLRHLAFMLLARLGGIPPTLYVPAEEAEHAAIQEPAVSLQTQALPQGDAKSGQAKSGGSAQGPHLPDEAGLAGAEVRSPLRLDPNYALPAEARAASNLGPSVASVAPQQEHQQHALARQDTSPERKRKTPSARRSDPPGLVRVSTEEMQRIMMSGPQGKAKSPGPRQPTPPPAAGLPQAAAGPAGMGAAVWQGPTQDELQAIMSAAPMTQPKRKKQKTDADGTAPLAHVQGPAVPAVQLLGADPSVPLRQQQQQQQLGRRQSVETVPVSASALESGSQLQQGQLSQPSSSTLPLATDQRQQPQQQQASIAQQAGSMPPPARHSVGAIGLGVQGTSGHGSEEAGQVAGSGQAVWEWEAERLRRKEQRQQEKLLQKANETPEEKEARRKAKRDKKALKRAGGGTSMADSDDRTVDFSEITS